MSCTVWPDAAAVSPGMQRMPATIPVAEIEAAVKDAGGYYPGGEVRRFHAALNFLAAQALCNSCPACREPERRSLLCNTHAPCTAIADPKLQDPFLFVCPVRPEWTDPTGLTGYYDVLSNRYVVPPFLEAVLVATAHRGVAGVRRARRDESGAGRALLLGCAVRDRDRRSRCSFIRTACRLREARARAIPAALPLPQNLYITGTINVDETTNPVSDKVLDRAVVIDMSTVDLPGFLAGLGSRRSGARRPRGQPARIICVAVHGLMIGTWPRFRLPRGRGSRPLSRIRGTASWRQRRKRRLDDLMVQKVLVKLRGGERQRRLLTGLAAAAGWPAAVAGLHRAADRRSRRIRLVPGNPVGGDDDGAPSPQRDDRSGMAGLAGARGGGAGSDSGNRQLSVRAARRVRTRPLARPADRRPPSGGASRAARGWPAGAGRRDFMRERWRRSCVCPAQSPRRFEVITDPDMRKLTRDDFDGMVREILDDTFALFSLSSFRKGVARGSGNRPPAIARLEFLRSRVEELERAVAAIARTPRRMLTAEETRTAVPSRRPRDRPGNSAIVPHRERARRSRQSRHGCRQR